MRVGFLEIKKLNESSKKTMPFKVWQAALVNSVFAKRDWGSHVTVEQTAYHRNICKNQKEIFCRIICENTVIVYSLEILAAEPICNYETDGLS